MQGKPFVRLPETSCILSPTITERAGSARDLFKASFNTASFRTVLPARSAPQQKSAYEQIADWVNRRREKAAKLFTKDKRTQKAEKTDKVEQPEKTESPEKGNT